ncbi:hypothetical protein EWM64_g2252 [Hericium alpestre]|uniref:Inhibitor I9 domain-containing protein n=1 Tax=Hericium alpestre TaxID=135208 RepID=A0A4Z0A7Z8_9AGAM|nr:hypothetical protein EWM64_g2252 [Hericium alpestre]
MSGRYIVVFKKTASDADVQKYVKDVTSNGGTIHNEYTSVMKGFSAQIPDSFLQTLQSNLQDGPIDYIEPDSIVHTQ